MKTNMTKVGFMSFFQILSFAAMMQASSSPSNGPEKSKVAELTFAENKCQIKDYSGKASRNILFLAQADNVKYLFKADGFSFQGIKSDGTIENISNTKAANIGTVKSAQKIEMQWVGVNSNAEIFGAEEVSSRLSQHLNNQSSKDCKIRNFKKLYYTEIYPGVDLKYYERENRLKYDLIVRPGFSYADIIMCIEGANELIVNNNGQLIIKTSSGDIIEEAPLVLQDGKPLAAKWKIEDKTVRLEIKNHNPQKELYIHAGLAYTGNEEYKM